MSIVARLDAFYKGDMPAEQLFEQMQMALVTFAVGVLPES